MFAAADSKGSSRLAERQVGWALLELFDRRSCRCTERAEAGTAHRGSILPAAAVVAVGRMVSRKASEVPVHGELEGALERGVGAGRLVANARAKEQRESVFGFLEQMNADQAHRQS